MGGSVKGCKWWLGLIVNKIEISNPKISLINCIGTPPHYPCKNTLSIADSGANTQLAKQSTKTMATVIISNNVTARLLDKIIMESFHIDILQLSVLSKQARQIHIFQKIKTAPLISLGLFFYDEYRTYQHNKLGHYQFYIDSIIHIWVFIHQGYETKQRCGRNRVREGSLLPGIYLGN